MVALIADDDGREELIREAGGGEGAGTRSRRRCTGPGQLEPEKKNALMSQQFDGTVGNGQVRAKL